MALTQSTETTTAFLRSLSTGDFEDLHVISSDTAERVLTPERRRLLAAIETDDIESVRALARSLDRNVSAVSRDLDVLFEADLIEYERDGRSKRPLLAHQTVLIEPLVFDGEVQV